MTRAAIVGVGLHPFGRFPGTSGADMAEHAIRQALADAGMTWTDVQSAVGGSAASVLPKDESGEPVSGTPDTLVNRLGLTGVPFVNVMNYCATAGTALATAVNGITSGQFDTAVAFGFDKHARGHFNLDASTLGLEPWYGECGFMLSTQFFAMKLVRYMHDFGISEGTLAKVASKAFRNAAINPNGWRRTPFTEEEILHSRMVNHPLRQLMFCSPNEGAAAVVLCREDRADRYTDRPAFVAAATTRTRRFGTFEAFSPWTAIDRAPSPTVEASKAAYQQAGITPADVDVAQIQDSEAGAEVIHMAENGFCLDGEQEEMIARGETEIGGRLPINTDGGLIANGEPVGASGMRQVVETALQLRGDAGERQVPGSPRVGYTQVYGAPGVSAVSILTR